MGIICIYLAMRVTTDYEDSVQHSIDGKCKLPEPRFTVSAGITEPLDELLDINGSRHCVTPW